MLGFTTARLDLGPLTPADAGPLRDAIDWDRAEAPLTGWTVDRLDELLGEDPTRVAAAIRRGPTLVGAVLAKPTGRVLTLDGLVMPAWRGVGYAVEVLGAIVDRTLAGVDAYDEVRVLVSAGNTAAIRAARAVGFAAVAIPKPTRPDGFRGDQVELTAGPELAGRPRRVIDRAYVERLIATLGAFEARSLVDHDASRAGREYPPLRRHPMAIDELPEILARGGTDFEAARSACAPGGLVDKSALARSVRGLGEGSIAELQRMLRTGHSSASEYAEAMAADRLLRRVRKASPR